MFYRPETGHGLPHNPFGAIVSPRPIGWISTRASAGDNLAPYSFFNAVAYKPAQVMFASVSAKPDRAGTKDSVAQIRESGVFAVNIAGYDDRAAVNASSAPLEAGQDEFAHASIAKAECEVIDCPRVAQAPATLECRQSQIIELDGAHNVMVIGTVVGVHLRDDCLSEGRFDVTRYNPLTRLGYMDYAAIREVFELERPDGHSSPSKR